MKTNILPFFLLCAFLFGVSLMLLSWLMPLLQLCAVVFVIGLFCAVVTEPTLIVKVFRFVKDSKREGNDEVQKASD